MMTRKRWGQAPQRSSTDRVRMVRNDSNLAKPPIVPCGRAFAEDGEQASEEIIKPIVVEMCFGIRNLAEYNAVTFTVEVDIELVWYWRDPRQANKRQSELGVDTPLWFPMPSVANAQGGCVVGKPDCTLLGDEHGTVKAIATVRGTCRNPMDLHDFPFDFTKPEVVIDFQEAGLIASQVVLRLPRDDGLMAHYEAGGTKGEEGNRGATGATGAQGDTQEKIRDADVLALDTEFSSLVEWETLGFGVYSRTAHYRKPYSQIVLTTVARRRPFYYVMKVYGLFALSTVLCFMVYAMDEVDNRLSLVATMFLANGALMLLANATLPHCGYLTAIDKAMLLSFAIIVTIGIDVILLENPTHRLGHSAQNISMPTLACLFVSMTAHAFFAPAQRWSRTGVRVAAFDEIQACLRQGSHGVWRGGEPLGTKKDELESDTVLEPGEFAAAAGGGLAGGEGNGPVFV
jgi:hypothetical protein